jgi:hypothetical protein
MQSRCFFGFVIDVAFAVVMVGFVVVVVIIGVGSSLSLSSQSSSLFVACVAMDVPVRC